MCLPVNFNTFETKTAISKLQSNTYQQASDDGSVFDKKDIINVTKGDFMTSFLKFVDDVTSFMAGVAKSIWDSCANFFEGLFGIKQDNETDKNETDKNETVKNETVKNETENATSKEKSPIEVVDDSTNVEKTNKLSVAQEKTEASKVPDDANPAGAVLFSKAEEMLGKNYYEMVDAGMSDILNNVTKPRGFAWCADFVSYCMNQTYGDNMPGWYKELDNYFGDWPYDELSWYNECKAKYPEYENLNREDIDNVMSKLEAQLNDAKGRIPTQIYNGDYSEYNARMQEYQDILGRFYAVECFRAARNRHSEWACNNVWQVAQENNRTFEDTSMAKRGDIVIFDTPQTANDGEKHHIGIVDYVEYDDNGNPIRVHTIEGNPYGENYNPHTTVVEKRVYDCATNKNVDESVDGGYQTISGYIRPSGNI